MTNFDTVTSPAGNVYPADQKITARYWNEEDRSPWKWVGNTDLRGDLSWEFDEAAVWQHEVSKDIIVARDSGCSCPIPFENLELKDAAFLTSLKDFDSFIEENEERTYSWDDNPSERYPSVVDQIVVLRKQIEDLLA